MTPNCLYYQKDCLVTIVRLLPGGIGYEAKRVWFGNNQVHADEFTLPAATVGDYKLLWLQPGDVMQDYSVAAGQVVFTVLGAAVDTKTRKLTVHVRLDSKRGVPTQKGSNTGWQPHEKLLTAQFTTALVRSNQKQKLL